MTQKKITKRESFTEIKEILEDKYGLEVKNESDIYGAFVTSIDDNQSVDDDDDMQDYSEYATASASHNEYLDTMEKEDLSYQMQQALNSLSEREQTIVKMANGIGYTKEYKDKEIAQELGLSTERVRQIKHSATKKMAEVYCVA
jgi:RNA polymerase sigma factor (sigma-70 family)